MEPSIASATFALSPNLAALTDLFNQCFGRQAVLCGGRSANWSEAAVAETLRQPGLATTFGFSGGGAACLFPQHLLPDWAAQPDHEQRQRLQGLAWEWSRHACPAAGDATQASARHVPDLAAYVDSCQPAVEAQAFEIIVQYDGVPAGTLFLIGPLAQPHPSEVAAADVQNGSSTVVRGADPLARLRQIPVPVSVRLAEKRISLSQLLSMTPGSLITFSKPFDDLLDLYVNNALYCRGEAVKIGEKFGLKINEVGVAAEQPTRLVNG